MLERKYDIKKNIERDVDKLDYYTHQTFPCLISGLKEMCLVKLIEINPLKVKLVPVQRE